MHSMQRAFAQKLSTQQAADVRKQISFSSLNHKSCNKVDGRPSEPISPGDGIDPYDYEDFIQQHQSLIDRDKLKSVIDFPANDIQVCVEPRKLRTKTSIIPKEPINEFPVFCKECIQRYTRDWVIVEFCYRHYSTSYALRDRLAERDILLGDIPHREFELDLKQCGSSTYAISESDDTQTLVGSEASSTRQSFVSHNSVETQRSSWASFDLINSFGDPLLLSLLDQYSCDNIDQMNHLSRQADRQDALMLLYAPAQVDAQDCIERRLQPEYPVEHTGHRILVECTSFEMELEIEPIFASMALYDCKEKKKISENFYFDTNNDEMNELLTGHVPSIDSCTRSRSCIFNITFPSYDIFLVIKLEKVLQGDINDCIEPYVKDNDKNLEKLKGNSAYFCKRLGQYRMPFCWTAVHLSNILNGISERDSISEKDKITSNSLDRKLSGTSLEQLRKKASEIGLSRRGSLERKSNSEKPINASSEIFDNFRPLTVSVTNFFKQEYEKLKDEDLYKFLQDLKKCPTKKLKTVIGNMKLDISPYSEDMKISCLTTELEPLNQFDDTDPKIVREIAEFPAKSVFVPHYVYRNLLFVYPKELNFTSRTGTARNIAVKVEVLSSEDKDAALKAIFGKSCGPALVSNAYTSVSYHNRYPSFYDEIKIQLPANLSDQHHLFFTFYHISCQKKENNPVETAVGYSWIPLLRQTRLQIGEFNLPVTLDYPPPNYSYISADVQLPGIKWVDNHKGLFTVSISCISSIHTADTYLDDFFHYTSMLDECSIPHTLSSNFESEFSRRILNLRYTQLESLVKFLPVVLDKLLILLVKSPVVEGVTLNIGPTVFEAIAILVKIITTKLAEPEREIVGWHNLLSTYISYECAPPYSINVPCRLRNPQLLGKGGTSNDKQSAEDREIENVLRGLQGIATGTFDNIQDSRMAKILHEEIAQRWNATRGETRENAMANSWFFFDLIIKSMATFLASTNSLNSLRKERFSERFLDDISTLVTTFTSDIISGYNERVQLTQSTNASLAFFIFDLFSIADRGFVFILLANYYKRMSAKISCLPDDCALYSLKLDFTRIIFSHEHFVALNLPYGTPFTSASAPVSPTLSTSSLNSQSSTMSAIASKDKNKFAELSREFRQRHYLVGLLFSDLVTILDMRVPTLRNKVIDMIRTLMTSHDSDDRYAQPDYKARVAALYLPLLFIVMDMLPQLYSWNNDTKGKSLLSEDNESEMKYGIQPSVAMAIAGSSIYGIKLVNSDVKDSSASQSRKCALSNEATQNLLICFLWILKSSDKGILKRWWMEWPVYRMRQLLETLNICIARFEYKGKAFSMKSTQPTHNKSMDVKSRLEDIILGQGSARSELMMRRKGSPGDRLRWRKEHVSYRSAVDVTDRSNEERDTNSYIEGNLATEISFIILDTLEMIIQLTISSDHFHGILECVLKVLLHALSRNQSTCVLQSMFATQRSIVYKFPNLLFDEETELCADLCLLLLQHCTSSLSSIRSQSAASLYMLMRLNFEMGNNFARVKMQVTMSLSSLVGTSRTFNEFALRRSLKTILLYAEEDGHLQDTTFPEQVKDLVFNLHMILSDTVKMKEFQEDPEMLLDLMYRIAKGYQNSPDLRVTWLANMAQKHMERNNHTEAGMCLVHSAALVAEYLRMLEDRAYLPFGAVALETVTPNVLEECAISDDVLSPDEEGFCLGKDFTESGFIGILEHAASSFQLAGMYEAMNNVYKVMIPIIERNRDYKKLSNIHGKLHEAYNRLEQLQGKRIFGTYFRVGFYGSKFGDLNATEYVYKEPTLTKLSEIFNRLQNFYSECFGPDVVQIIKDSNVVDSSKLNAEKAYIQITYVEPYFEPYEYRFRVTNFDRNFNIKKFVFSTPFTANGRAHGELREQYKKKTIITVVNHFPYVKTRIQVFSKKQIILTPIEVAIEDIQKKTVELAQAILQDPPDRKILQMVLQGCIGTTVNQGPMEMATVFLSPTETHISSKLQNKLRLCFKDFSKKCFDALKKNKHLIGPDQKEYQRELERNYLQFTQKLNPLIAVKRNESSNL